jgi:restriction system protein
MEEILIGFTRLPLWASIVGAVLVYFALRFIPSLFAGGSISAAVYAGVFSTLAPWIAILILLAGLVGVAGRRWDRIVLTKGTALASIRQLGWEDLERLVGEAYRRQGYYVLERGGPQPDGGIDLELVRGGEKVVVQCKHWLMGGSLSSAFASFSGS